MEYGPWIAFNEGDTPPADDVVVQVQLAYDRRIDVAGSDDNGAACNWAWRHGITNTVIAYRVVKRPVRGEVVYDGALRTCYSLNVVTTTKLFDKEADHVHVTFTTADGLLIPGTYTGPDGATIKIEVVE